MRSRTPFLFFVLLASLLALSQLSSASEFEFQPWSQRTAEEEKIILEEFRKLPLGVKEYAFRSYGIVIKQEDETIVVRGGNFILSKNITESSGLSRKESEFVNDRMHSDIPKKDAEMTFRNLVSDLEKYLIYNKERKETPDEKIVNTFFANIEHMARLVDWKNADSITTNPLANLIDYNKTYAYWALDLLEQSVLSSNEFQWTAIRMLLATNEFSLTAEERRVLLERIVANAVQTDRYHYINPNVRAIMRIERPDLLAKIENAEKKSGKQESNIYDAYNAKNYLSAGLNAQELFIANIKALSPRVDKGLQDAALSLISEIEQNSRFIDWDEFERSSDSSGISGILGSLAFIAGDGREYAATITRLLLNLARQNPERFFLVNAAVTSLQSAIKSSGASANTPNIPERRGYAEKLLEMYRAFPNISIYLEAEYIILQSIAPDLASRFKELQKNQEQNKNPT